MKDLEDDAVRSRLANVEARGAEFCLRVGGRIDGYVMQSVPERRLIASGFRTGISAVLLLGLLLVAAVWLRERNSQAGPSHLELAAVLPIPEGQRGYTTNFSRAENPISEARNWVDGKTIGLDWSDIATVAGLAYGTESGRKTGDEVYDDSTALLAGSWPSDQTVEATVHSVNQHPDVFEEVELRLRSSLTAHNSTGYEVLYRCLNTDQAYASIVRWNGPLGNFTYLAQEKGSGYRLSDGDLVSASINGNVITAYINGKRVMQTSDKTYTSGTPGMGFWLKRRSGVGHWFRRDTVRTIDYGFTRFAAW